MSASAVPVTLLIIGGADNVRELLGKHPSLQRTLVTIPMPLMTRREIDGIIASGEGKNRSALESALAPADRRLPAGAALSPPPAVPLRGAQCGAPAVGPCRALGPAL